MVRVDTGRCDTLMKDPQRATFNAFVILGVPSSPKALHGGETTLSDNIPQAPPAQAVAWRQDGSPGGSGHGGRHGTGSHARATDAYGRLADDGLDVDDTIWVQGIPPEELTPAVRRAIAHLMAEVDRLHQELNARTTGPMPAPHSFESPQVNVDTNADATSHAGPDAGSFAPSGATPPLSAKEWEDAMKALLDVLAAGGAPPALAAFSLANADDLREQHGTAATMLAFNAMTDGIGARLVSGDVMGWTGETDVAVALPFDGQVSRLWDRARDLARQGEVTVEWHGHALRTHVRLGVHVCQAGETPAEAMAQAQHAQRRLV